MFLEFDSPKHQEPDELEDRQEPSNLTAVVLPPQTIAATRSPGAGV